MTEWSYNILYKKKMITEKDIDRFLKELKRKGVWVLELG